MYATCMPLNLSGQLLPVARRCVAPGGRKVASSPSAGAASVRHREESGAKPQTVHVHKQDTVRQE